MTRVLGLTLLIALLALAPASGQNAASSYVEPPNLPALIAAAAKEGTLELGVGNTFGGPKAAQIMQQHLNQKYHIDLKIAYSPISAGARFVAQLDQEVSAGQPASSDVMLTIETKEDAPYTQQVDWRKYMRSLPSDDMVYDMHAVRTQTTLEGFAYNTKLIPPSQVPKSFADLLDPKWKGKIATSPYQGLFMRYIGLPDVFGPTGMLDYVNKFVKQIGGVFVCGETDRVVSGEFAIFGLDCGDHETRLRQRRGEPIGEIYPKEGTSVNYITPAIPKTAVHPNAARLFIVYLLSPEGQDDLWTLAGEDNDRLPGSHMAVVMAGLRKQGVKLVAGAQGNAADLKYPQLDDWAREINNLVNQGR